MTLSLCMIVRDEGAVLGRCLQSAAPLCDEIVVADTGSKDDTKKIALSFTDKVFDFAWREDFAAARNFAFAQAKGDYLLWLDADEVLLPRAAQALRALKERLRADACRLRTEIPDGRGGVALAFERVRIVRKEAGFLWHGRVHEYIAAGGDVARADIAVTHLGGPKRDPFRNLKIFARAFASGEAPDARQTYYFARELLDCGMPRTAAGAFEHFLRGEGWAEDKIAACEALSRCRAACGDGAGCERALLRAFACAPPRAETCCALGDCLREAGRFADAAFWYRLAVRVGPTRSGGFARPDCGGFIPCLWLCVCCYALGDARRAAAWNERAARYKPQDESVLHNRAFFDRLFSEK